MKKLITTFACAVACTTGIVSNVSAADAPYPVKPIRMLIGFAPGGGTDTTARAIADKLTVRLGQPVIVENRPGASGNIATEAVTRAAPDGYTILLSTIAPLAINPSIYKKLSFSPQTELAPVSRVIVGSNVLVVHPSVPANTVSELMALAKTRQLNGSSGGIGTGDHLALELFNMQAETPITHVTYKGGGPAMADLLGGHIQLGFATLAASVANIKAGKIRALGVTSRERSPLLPDVPTISESGLKDFEMYNWSGMLAPANTPRAIVERLSKEITAVLNMPEVKELLAKQGLVASPSTPDEFATYIRDETAKWEKVLKRAGLYQSM